MRFLTEIFESIRISLGAVLANKMRSTLATLGIVIGIVTVTLMSMAIEGINRAFQQSISQLGSDVIYINRFSWFINSHEEWLKVSRRREIDWAQYEAVLKQSDLAKAVAPMADVNRPVRYKNRQSERVNILGSTEQFAEIAGVSVIEGRFMSASESNGGRPVAVLGYQVATNLFIGESPIGQRIRIGGQSAEVIGVLGQQGMFLGSFSWDNRIVIPIRYLATAFRYWPDYEIQVKAADPARLDELRDQLNGIMRRARRLRPGDADDFSFNQQDMFLKTFERVSGIIAAGGLFITSLSLFVGGIGIMNIMFVSVAERTREIGIRKAIGAKRRSILLQFLLEAAGICLLGGLIGLGIAIAAMYGLRTFIPATLSPQIVTIALLISAATGIISGFLPAWRAARMNPVDALRSE